MFWKYLFLGLSRRSRRPQRAVGRAAVLRRWLVTDWIDLAAFTPVALIAAILVRAFLRQVVLVHPRVWRGVLFAAVFWKSISMGISVPTLVARVKALDLNAKG